MCCYCWLSANLTYCLSAHFYDLNTFLIVDYSTSLQFEFVELDRKVLQTEEILQKKENYYAFYLRRNLLPTNYRSLQWTLLNILILWTN